MMGGPCIVFRRSAALWVADIYVHGRGFMWWRAFASLYDAKEFGDTRAEAEVRARATLDRIISGPRTPPVPRQPRVVYPEITTRGRNDTIDGA